MSFDIGWIAHQKQDEVFYLKIVGEEGTLYAHKMEIVRPDGTTEIIGICKEDDLDEQSIRDFLNEVDGKPVKINQSMEEWEKVLRIMAFSLVPSDAETRHYYSPPLSECPVSAFGGTTSSPSVGCRGSAVGIGFTSLSNFFTKLATS